MLLLQHAFYRRYFVFIRLTSEVNTSQHLSKGAPQAHLGLSSNHIEIEVSFLECCNLEALACGEFAQTYFRHKSTMGHILCFSI